MRMTKPAIIDIASNCDEPLYFAKKELAFWGQRLSDFSVNATEWPNVWETRARVNATGNAGRISGFPLLDNGVGFPPPEGMESVALWRQDRHGRFTRARDLEK